MSEKKNYFNHQSGGMLLELMLSVSLAAIILPFLFRYQKNTIERARNIAVVKQMEIVQGALERCIFENRDKILVQGVSVLSENNAPSEIDCLMLSDCSKIDGGYECPDSPKGLINYGLPVEFAVDFGNDYKLRILKSWDNTDQPVLQGVVLLNNQNINALRTREIVRLGGGKVGFVDGNSVQGGYNTFYIEDKTDFRLQEIENAIVQTTDTMRGYSKYLWRLPSNNEEDATMLSWLNLDGHDIVNVNNFRGNKAIFTRVFMAPDADHDYGNANAGYVYFTQLSDLASACNGNQATVNGHLTISDSSATLNVGEKIDLRGVGNFDMCNSPVLIAGAMQLNNFQVYSKSLSVNSAIIVPQINAGEMVANDGVQIITPRLEVPQNSKIEDIKNSSYYWDVASNTAVFSDIELIGLSDLMTHLYESETNDFGRVGGMATNVYDLYSDDIQLKNHERSTVATYLDKLKYIRDKVEAKYACVKYGSYTKPEQSNPKTGAPPSGNAPDKKKFDNCIVCVKHYDSFYLEYCVTECVDTDDVDKCVEQIK